MTILSADLPSVLRRRSKEFAAAITCEPFVSPASAQERAEPLIRAAAELEQRADVATDPERRALEALADNRRLRKALVGIGTAMRQATRIAIKPSEAQRFAGLADKCRQALEATLEPGANLTILAIEIRPDSTRADLEARFAALMAETFPDVPPCRRCSHPFESHANGAALQHCTETDCECEGWRGMGALADDPADADVGPAT